MAAINRKINRNCFDKRKKIEMNLSNKVEESEALNTQTNYNLYN